jgi:hypothetical protein
VFLTLFAEQSRSKPTQQRICFFENVDPREKYCFIHSLPQRKNCVTTKTGFIPLEVYKSVPVRRFRMKKVALVALVVALGVAIAIPASAFFGMFGGGNRGGSCNNNYAPAYCAPMYCAPVYCAPAYCGPVGCAPVKGMKAKKGGVKKGK